MNGCCDRTENAAGCRDHTTNAAAELADCLKKAEAVVVGAGAGLSVSAGFTYSGERFHRYFQDFADHYGITDIYSGEMCIRDRPLRGQQVLGKGRGAGI